MRAARSGPHSLARRESRLASDDSTSGSLPPMRHVLQQRLERDVLLALERLGVGESASR